MEGTDLTSWRTSTYSSNGGATCVEIGDARHAVLIRDAQDHTGPVLRFSLDEWRRFTRQVKNGA
jgi:uncharacterized protein DUF397